MVAKDRGGRAVLLVVWMVVLLALMAACSPRTAQPNVEPTIDAPTPQVPTSPAATLAGSDTERDTSPQAAASDLQTLAAGNNAFAWDLYQQLRAEEGNLFYSPYSISLALAMTWAGARGDTEQQMAETLHFTLPQAQLHPAFNALDLGFDSIGSDGDEDERFQLNVANALWAQRDYTFLPEFLDLLAQNYGAGLALLDFQSDPEAARGIINAWVSDNTEEKIQDLIASGVLTEDTRLVLTNAIYFTANWVFQFDPASTIDRPFHRLDGSEVEVSMMTQKEGLRYAEGDGYQVVELPYSGADVSFIAILPAEGEFEAWEAALSAEQMETILGNLAFEEVVVTLPKFTYDSAFGLSETLKQMGMPAAFDDADFSGMDGTTNLAITDVIHKAFVAVDEEGTEAAAATAVVVGETAALPSEEEPKVMTLDRPFIFMIRDNATGTLLFVGRLIDPS